MTPAAARQPIIVAKGMSCVCHVCSAAEATPACMHADLNPQSLSPLSASRVFYGNGQLALVDGHVTLVL